MFNFLEMKTKVATLVQRSGDAAYVTKIGDWLNFAQDFAYRAYDYYAELEDSYSFPTVQGTSAYYMPALFSMPLRIYNDTNNAKVRIMTEETYNDISIGSINAASQGVPISGRLFGISPIKYPITSAVTLQAKSSLSTDTGSTVIRIEGYVDSSKSILGYDYVTIDSGSPTSYAAAAGSVSFYGITKIAKSSDTYGYITIADNNGNVLATIMPNERGSRYPVLNLGLIPDGVYNMRTLFKRRVNRMVNDNDYPFIDADEFFINYAYAYCLNEEKENVGRVPLITQKAGECLEAVIRNEQTRLGEDFQNKITHQLTQAFRT